MSAHRTPAPSAAAEFDRARLHAWLAGRLARWPDRPSQCQATRLQGGQSNPTWLLQGVNGSRWVLRARPGPATSLLPSAHAIEREFRVLKALQGSGVPVPEPLLHCEDESVIGASFYVMAFVDGRVLRDSRLPGMAASERQAVYEDAARVLAAMHRLDWQAAGLSGFGRPECFFERQITRWARQYDASTRDGVSAVDVMPRLTEALCARVPPPLAQLPATALIHGDYRLENLLYHPTQPRVMAVLDWELATLGHPLGDLGYHAMAWHLPAEPLSGLLGPGQAVFRTSGHSLGAAGMDAEHAGLPGLRAHVQGYLRAMLAATPAAVMHNPGDDPGSSWGNTHPSAWAAVWAHLQAHFDFYLAFNLFRLAAILQGIAHRQAMGLACAPHARQVAAMAHPVAERAWEVLSGQRPAW